MRGAGIEIVDINKWERERERDCAEDQHYVFRTPFVL